ncbi:NrfD/PsrC family molybdoenzyme membrane anchor subunit [Streptomyces sp. LN325]|uniref:NrfD/PsrC family molybdoenzyme membrane anchor subunit n=1 Tax=Streptomyces sp. LN325 TaxID=3112976 RepID=UPI003710C9CE
MVPRAEFRSYYGRPVLKPPVWEWKIPAYLLTGGLSAGAALLAAGADLTARPRLRRAGRVGGFAALLVSMYLLVADLGRPARFHHMMRVAKPSSPMSVGTWILIAYGPGSALAATAEMLPAAWRATSPGRLLHLVARPAACPRPCSPPASPRTRRSCSRRRRCPRGTTPVASCPSCSPAPRRPVPAASAWCWFR